MSGQPAPKSGGQEFEDLVSPLLDALYRTARTLTGDEHDASDLVQATCLKVLEQFGTFELGSNCKAWMMRIMRNTWIDQIRHRKVVGREIPIDEELLAAAPSADGIGQGQGLHQILERFSDAHIIRTLMELSEPQRMALFLSDVEGLSQEDVAEVLDVAVGTVKSRVSRARALLRDKLEDYALEMGFLERRSCRT